MNWKQAFMHGPHDLRIKTVEMPELGPYDVLVKLGACGICQSDVECFEGDSAEGRYDIAPYTPGHEWAGKVVQFGSAVTELSVGDKVVGDCVLPCKKCANCKDGKMPSACLNMREVGFRPDSPGGFGEYLVLEAEFLHKVPDDWSYEMGAWVETFNVGYWGVWEMVVTLTLRMIVSSLVPARLAFAHRWSAPLPAPTLSLSTRSQVAVRPR